MQLRECKLYSALSNRIDLTDGYFITEVLDCILHKKVLVTDTVNIIRDYVHPQDLFSIITKCIDAGNINEAFDVISAKPVEKRGIFDYFSTEYGLKYEVNQSSSHISATGSKNVYCSSYNKALRIGYQPKFSSMDTIKEESKYIIHQSESKVKEEKLWLL